MATFTFTIQDNVLFNSGIIEIDMPVWGTIYASDLSTSYAGNYGGEGFSEGSKCLSTLSDEPLSALFVTATKLQIKYTNALYTTGEIVLSCSNWRNPIKNEIIEGFFVRTIQEETMNTIDESSSLQLDASALTGAVAIDDSSFSYEMSSSFTSDFSDMTLSF